MSNPCATDNGGCGDPARWTCSTTTGGSPSCSDIDECATDNGGCGSATFYTCANNDGAAPTCADIDECATNNGDCGPQSIWTCTNNAGAAPTCDGCSTWTSDAAGSVALSSCTGVASWWQLDDCVGSTVTSVGGAHNGTATANPVWGAGKVRGGMEFDGSNYVRVPTAATLSAGTGDFSVSAWIKIPIGQQGQRRVVSMGSNGVGGHDGFSLMEWCAWGAVPCGGVGLVLGVDSAGEYLIGTCSAMDDGNWHHYVVTAQRTGSLALYVDGAVVASPCTGLDGGAAWAGNTAPVISHLSTTDLQFPCDTCLGTSCQNSGACNAGTSESFVGALDEPAFFNRLLSANEVASLYATGAGAQICAP